MTVGLSEPVPFISAAMPRLLAVRVTVVDSRFRVLLTFVMPVDSEATLPFVALRLVDSEFTPLCTVLNPVKVDVDSELTLLFVALRPVDSE
ncbi:hypothetical protein WK57_18210 [Burkholderia ubonensis]|uniref:Uncharacterized protein n=1 Tax=Burkholderia ubonensis TaxID=101571 RepID=A0AA40R8P1_9BURK|nr:hypothetical protein WL43_08265 [Burkholderia ubonensis]KWZ58418.1 hypothetical protein WK57_18210 [Burkholderia ubonensis]